MAAAKKGGLGKGLDSLIANKVGTTGTAEVIRMPEPDKEVSFVKITKVEPNRRSEERRVGKECGS